MHQISIFFELENKKSRKETAAWGTPSPNPTPFGAFGASTLAPSALGNLTSCSIIRSLHRSIVYSFYTVFHYNVTIFALHKSIFQQ